MRESLRNPCPTQGRNSSSAHNRGGTWLPLTNESRRPRSNRHANWLNLVQPLLLFREKTRADETLISSNHDQVSPPNMHLTFYDNIDISFIASAFLSRSSMLCYLWRVLRQPPTISKTFVVSLVREDEFTNKSFRQSQAIWMPLSLRAVKKGGFLSAHYFYFLRKR